MADKIFPRKPLGELQLDICFACQGIWFDEFESLQLAPAGVVALFRQIHERRDEAHTPWPDRLACPRCGDALMQGYDLSKNGKFSYHRCLQGHGRLTSFSAFMIEKGFVRQLNGAEIAELAKKVQTVRCSGCGAPVDIRRDCVCNHCRAPIVVLDPEAVDKALESYSQAAAREGMVNIDAFADALLIQEKQKYERQRERQAHSLSGYADNSGDLIDLVTGGAELIGNLLSD